MKYFVLIINLKLEEILSTWAKKNVDKKIMGYS